MANVDFSRAAEQEYLDALAWYSTRSLRPVAAFEESVQKLLQRIASNPLQFPECEVDADSRFAMLSDYPYSLIYQILDGDVLIVALAHARRRPGYWLDRQ